MINSMSLMDKLQERGFTPEEAEDGWFLLPLGSHKVRVCLDDYNVTIYVITKNEVGVWNADFSARVPAHLILMTVDLAIADAVSDAVLNDQLTEGRSR